MKCREKASVGEKEGWKALLATASHTKCSFRNFHLVVVVFLLLLSLL